MGVQLPEWLPGRIIAWAHGVGSLFLELTHYSPCNLSGAIPCMGLLRMFLYLVDCLELAH